RLRLSGGSMLAPGGLDPASEERDRVTAPLLAEVSYIASQQRQRRALGVLVIVERLPLELNFLAGRRRAPLQHLVHLLDATAHLVDPMPQVIGNLLDERLAEHPALLDGQDLLAVGDLRAERLEYLRERLLATTFGDVHEQQLVVASGRVSAHVGLRQLPIEQLDSALDLDAELACGAAHREQLLRKRACDLERTGESPAGGLLSVDGHGVAEHRLQDPRLRQLPEGDACRLTPRARGLVLACAYVSVPFQPGER